MPISGKDLIDMSEEEFDKVFPKDRCNLCSGFIEGHQDEGYAISGRPVCSGCYFTAIGEEIERNPIYNPLRR